MIERCGDCRWWNKGETECWRNPPTPWLSMQPRPLGGVDHVVLAMHPPVPETAWCGEFEMAKGNG